MVNIGIQALWFACSCVQQRHFVPSTGALSRAFQQQTSAKLRQDGFGDGQTHALASDGGGVERITRLLSRSIRQPTPCVVNAEAGLFVVPHPFQPNK